MSEYIITIDDWFFESVQERYTHFFGCPIEEVVRCRDCRYRAGNGVERKRIDPYLCFMHDKVMIPEYFCADGERRVEQ